MNRCAHFVGGQFACVNQKKLLRSHFGEGRDQATPSLSKSVVLCCGKLCAGVKSHQPLSMGRGRDGPLLNPRVTSENSQRDVTALREMLEVSSSLGWDAQAPNER